MGRSLCGLLGSEAVAAGVEVAKRLAEIEKESCYKLFLLTNFLLKQENNLFHIRKKYILWENDKITCTFPMLLVYENELLLLV